MPLKLNTAEDVTRAQIINIAASAWNSKLSYTPKRVIENLTAGSVCDELFIGEIFQDSVLFIHMRKDV